MSKVIAVVATMDTKGVEANFLRDQLELLGAKACLIDIGVVGPPKTKVDYTREQVFEAAGEDFEKLMESPTRQAASPIVIKGVSKILQSEVAADRIHAVIGMGGTQGTPNCAHIFQQLPYGLPKIILSTIASGDTSGLMDIKDITLMPSVADILGLNPFTRKVLCNLAGAAYGMSVCEPQTAAGTQKKTVIGMTNLGVLTDGATQAIEMFENLGYEVITFHAVGTGGRAMEQMMREGLINAVFDYALGEIADEVYECLRAANKERLTVAAELGLPQVVCPGGAEHLGIWVNEPDSVPEKYKNHQYIFHNPYVFVPRLTGDEIRPVAKTVCDRLQGVKGNCAFLIPEKGVSRYSVEGGPLYDSESDHVFFDTLRENLPPAIDCHTHPYSAEDPQFIEQAVTTLAALIEKS